MASKTSRATSWVLLTLLIIGLAVFWKPNFGGRVASIGTIGETEIDANRYARALNNELRAIQAQTGQTVPLSQAQQFGLDKAVLGRLLTEVTLENEAARLGLSMGDANIRDQLVAIPAFQGVNGTFDREAYKFYLDQNNQNAAGFEASLRAEMARTILQGAVATGVKTPDAFVDTLYGWARETRDFTWGQIGAGSLETALPEPSEQDLVAYYEAHPQDFTLPQTKKITYVWLSPDALIDTVDVTEEDLRAEYANRSAEYNIPERRLVERLIMPDADTAARAAAALASGEKSFEQLVQERDLDLSDIDLGDVSREDLGGDAAEAVFAMAEPGVTGPVETDFGPALFRLNAILAAQVTTFEEARADLREALADDRVRRAVADMSTALDDELVGGATLEELATATQGMEIGKIDWFAGQSAGIAAYEEFRAAAANVTVDDYPEIAFLADGGAFALRMDEAVLPRLQELDEVRDAVIAGWEATETARAVREKAESLLPALESGDEALSTLGFTEIHETGQGREAFIEGAPPQLMTEVFEMQPDEWRVIGNGENAILVRLNRVRAADQDSDEAKTVKQGFAAQTAQSIAGDIERAMATALQAQAGITLDQPVIQAVHSQFP